MNSAAPSRQFTLTRADVIEDILGLLALALFVFGMLRF